MQDWITNIVSHVLFPSISMNMIRVSHATLMCQQCFQNGGAKLRIIIGPLQAKRRPG